jgi:hypothetical protein
LDLGLHARMSDGGPRPRRIFDGRYFRDKDARTSGKRAITGDRRT